MKSPRPKPELFQVLLIEGWVVIHSGWGRSLNSMITKSLFKRVSFIELLINVPFECSTFKVHMTQYVTDLECRMSSVTESPYGCKETPGLHVTVRQPDLLRSFLVFISGWDNIEVHSRFILVLELPLFYLILQQEEKNKL